MNDGYVPPKGLRPVPEAPGQPLNVDALRRAIYTISIRHDWENTTDREDRTEEIAAEYARLIAEFAVDEAP